RERGARHPADLALTHSHGCPARGNGTALDPYPDQPSRDAAVPAVLHADDHFLPDVTALREADGPRFDAGLERDRLLVHVAMKARHAGLDANGLGGPFVECDDTRTLECRAKRVDLRAVDVQVEPRFSHIARPRHDDGRAALWDPDVA